MLGKFYSKCPTVLTSALYYIWEKIHFTNEEQVTTSCDQWLIGKLNFIPNEGREEEKPSATRKTVFLKKLSSKLLKILLACFLHCASTKQSILNVWCTVLLLPWPYQRPSLLHHSRRPPNCVRDICVIHVYFQFSSIRLVMKHYLCFANPNLWLSNFFENLVSHYSLCMEYLHYFF